MHKNEQPKTTKNNQKHADAGTIVSAHGDNRSTVEIHGEMLILHNRRSFDSGSLLAAHGADDSAVEV